MTTAKQRTTLQTVERAFALLELVAASPTSLSVAEAAKILGINTSTCHHLVKTLEGGRYLRRDAARCLRLDFGIVRLNAGFFKGQVFSDELRRVLQGIASSTGETAFASEWDGNDMIIKHVVEGTYTLRVTGLSVGLRGSPHSRASGKAVLAFLPTSSQDEWLERSSLEPATRHTISDREIFREELARVHETGFATDLEEFATGVCCVAAPYFDRNRTVLGAVTIASSQARFENHMQEYREAVIAASGEVTALLSQEHPPASASYPVEQGRLESATDSRSVPCTSRPTRQLVVGIV